MPINSGAKGEPVILVHGITGNVAAWQVKPLTFILELRSCYSLSHQRGRACGLYVMCADLGVTHRSAWLGLVYQTYGTGIPFYANGIILALAYWCFLYS